MIYIIGGILALAGWAVQGYKTWIKKERALSPILFVLYGAACVLYTIGNFLDNDIFPGILNIVCIVLAVIVLAGLLSKKRAV